MNLGELITRLEAADPNQAVQHGFTNPHSYRGDYMDLAFEPAADVTVGDMLADARSALGTTYQGWKGGDFTMNEHTWCWLSQQGDASGETISPLLLEFMLTEPAVQQPPVDRAAKERRLDLSQALGLGAGAPWDAILDRAAELRRLADETQQPTPCSGPVLCEDGGEPCDRHEREHSHAEGEHAFCGVECEVVLPSEQLRNMILYRAIPGSKGALAELERRAAAGAQQDGAQP